MTCRNERSDAAEKFVVSMLNGGNGKGREMCWIYTFPISNYNFKWALRITVVMFRDHGDDDKSVSLFHICGAECYMLVSLQPILSLPIDFSEYMWSELEVIVALGRISWQHRIHIIRLEMKSIFMLAIQFKNSICHPSIFMQTFSPTFFFLRRHSIYLIKVLIKLNFIAWSAHKWRDFVVHIYIPILPFLSWADNDPKIDFFSSSIYSVFSK